MNETLQILLPLVLVVACCGLFGLEQTGKGFMFLRLTSDTWATLAGLGAIAGFASVFWRRSE